MTATRPWLALAPRRTAVISGPAGYLCARARLDGYRAAMDAAGVGVEESLVRVGRFCVEDGLRFGTELLDRPDRPTAIVAGNDLQAIGVYEAARRAGLTIPKQLSVVGFHDLEDASLGGPPLPTGPPPLGGR